MPKRTNDFQKLVDIIQRLYAPKNATVTTSAMVTPLSGGTPREIDILVEFKTDLYPFKVAVEAKDHSRSIDAMVVETYGGKYNSNGGIIVDKVIIVAHSFTETAKQRANELGFSLHTINELDSGVEGLFGADKVNSGYWCISPEKPNKNVKVAMFDKQGHNVLLSSNITPRTSKLDLGRAIDFAQRILEKSAGKIANDQYAKFAGDMTQVVIEVQFPNHKARIGKKAVNLRKMVFYFGKRMLIPPTKAQQFELKTDSADEKTIIHETGIGTEAKMSMTYEKQNDGHPKGIYVNREPVEGKPAQGKRVIIKMELDEALGEPASD
jgi:hypothetical protein